MDKDQIKQLLEIAKACRKVGITHFKNELFEITLSDEAPAPLKPRGKSAKKPVNQESLAQQLDSEGGPTEEELLLWSTGSLAPLNQ